MTTPGGTVQLQNADLEYAAHYIDTNSKWPFPVIPMNCAKGKSVVICGAGPSLSSPEALETIHHVGKQKGQVWGCNVALKWLKNNGKYVTHGVAIDPTLGMLDHWSAGYDVAYLLASSVNPKLVSMLVKHKRHRIAFFHSYIGTLGRAEMNLYETLYGQTVLVGEGLNVVNRVVRLADFMGFERIFVAGADCCLEMEGSFHVGGGSPDGKLYYHTEGEVTKLMGRQVRTTPDMAMSAIDLAKAKRKYGNRLVLLGDTLPKAITGQSDDLYDGIIKWATVND